MRTRITTVLLPGILAVALSLSLAAQQKPADDKSKNGKKEPPPPLTISGCVVKDEAANEYTIDDQAVGKYRVSGNQIKRYVGQRVEVVGTIDNSRLKVRGGLYPSPNAAGQAGAMDPVKSAMAAQPGGTASGTGDIELPQIKVRSVKTLSGGCR